MDDFRTKHGYPPEGRKQLKDVTNDDIRANHGVLGRLDKRWRDSVDKVDRMPHGFRMTKREHDEYVKQLGRNEGKKAKKGRATYNGAKMIVR